MERKIIYNGRIILPDEIYRNGAVVINEFGIIDDIIKVENGRTLEDLIKKYSERIDAEEGLIALGTIAIHEHGLDDFFVVENQRRKGMGNVLFDDMLKELNIISTEEIIKKIVVNKPSVSFSRFLIKRNYLGMGVW